MISQVSRASAVHARIRCEKGIRWSGRPRLRAYQRDMTERLVSVAAEFWPGARD
jgi:hypothetical protein